MVLIGACFLCVGFFALDPAVLNNLFLSVTLFGLALVSLSMAMSSCFTDSKLSPQVGMTLILLPTSIYFYVLTDKLSDLGMISFPH